MADRIQHIKCLQFEPNPAYFPPWLGGKSADRLSFSKPFLAKYSSFLDLSTAAETIPLPLPPPPPPKPLLLVLANEFMLVVDVVKVEDGAGCDNSGDGGGI
jgi:hypothetical protein